MYHNDSARQVTYAFDLDDDGNASNRRVFASFGEGDGYPDGMTVDADGCLWIAFWDGWCVRRYSPAGNCSQTIDVPVARPTSCAFGGAGPRPALHHFGEHRPRRGRAGGATTSRGVCLWWRRALGASPKFPLQAELGRLQRLKETEPSPTSCSRPGSRTASRRSTTARPASTRWSRAAITSGGARISTASRKSASIILRYGPPLHRTFLGPNKYDWEFADLTFADLRRREITPIVDLCHFGVPDWIGNFQNPDFPQLFADYAGAFAERYPWVQLYTPINEMFICAVFSAKYGWWNEQTKDDRSFVTALKNIVKANVMAMIEILKRRHDAIFIQSESSEYYHADSPGRDRPRRKCSTRCGSCRSTSITAAGSTAGCTNI